MKVIFTYKINSLKLINEKEWLQILIIPRGGSSLFFSALFMLLSPYKENSNFYQSIGFNDGINISCFNFQVQLRNNRIITVRS